MRPLFVTGFRDDQSGEDFTVQTPHRRSGQHPLGRSTTTHNRMHAAADDGRGDTGGEIAVANEADTRARRPNFRDELLVSWPIEHDHHEILDATAKRLRDRPQVETYRRIEIDDIARDRTDDEVLPAHVGRMNVSGAFSSAPLSAAATAAIAFGAPVASRSVLSSGSTGMST